MRLPPGRWVMHSGSLLSLRKISSLLIKSWVLLLPTASSSPLQFDLKEWRRELVPGTLRESFRLSVSLKCTANLVLHGDAYTPKEWLMFRGFALLSRTNLTIIAVPGLSVLLTDVLGSPVHFMLPCLGAGCCRGKMLWCFGMPMSHCLSYLLCCSWVSKEINTDTDEDTRRVWSSGLFWPWSWVETVSVLLRIPSLDRALWQSKMEEKNTSVVRREEMLKPPVLGVLNHHF